MESKLDQVMDVLEDHFRMVDIHYANGDGLKDKLAAILAQPDALTARVAELEAFAERVRLSSLASVSDDIREAAIALLAKGG